MQNVRLDLSDVPSAATADVLTQLLCNERPREAQLTVITNQTHIQEGLDNERARKEAERAAAMVSPLISPCHFCSNRPPRWCPGRLSHRRSRAWNIWAPAAETGGRFGRRTWKAAG